MNGKQEIINQFDPNGPAEYDDHLFGLPFMEDNAEIHVLPLPWEVTVSYHSGTAGAPDCVLRSSLQVDLFDPVVADAWQIGYHLLEENQHWKNQNRTLRAKAVQIIDYLMKGGSDQLAARTEDLLNEINAGTHVFREEVGARSLEILKKNKMLIGLGGDHSTPLGIFDAMAIHHGEFGILQLDAHADLREAYEGFTYSHASIMYNALSIPQVTKLVQVGIRDYCEEEFNRIHEHKNRVDTFFYRDLMQQRFKGVSFQEQTARIIGALPDKVFISFDLDALDPKLCPATGTPVQGGFETEEVLFLTESLVESGRTIIGMDFNETGPAEWDASVTARLLYRMGNLMALSNKKAKRR